jgi:hypothetical protein
MRTLATASRTWGAVLLGLTAALFIASSAAVAGQWDPAAFATQDTLRLRTTRAGEGEHWFKVWLVVIDSQVYVRLGSHAAERVKSNTTAPVLGVEVAGQRFDRVRGVPAPEYAERVAKAMAKKYTIDIFVHLVSHPLTLRLVPEDLSAAPATP